MAFSIHARVGFDSANYRIKSADSLRCALVIAAPLIVEQLDCIARVMTCIGMKLDYPALIREVSVSEDEKCSALWDLTSDILNLFDRQHELDDCGLSEAVALCVAPLKSNPSEAWLSTEELWKRLLVGCIAFTQGWTKVLQEPPESNVLLSRP